MEESFNDMDGPGGLKKHAYGVCRAHINENINFLLLLLIIEVVPKHPGRCIILICTSMHISLASLLIPTRSSSMPSTSFCAPPRHSRCLYNKMASLHADLTTHGEKLEEATSSRA